MGIERLLDWDFEISPLAADRAIVWCSNVDQQKTLVSLGRLPSPCCCSSNF